MNFVLKNTDHSKSVTQDSLALFELLWNTPSSGKYSVIPHKYAADIGFTKNHKKSRATMFYTLQPNALYPVLRPNISWFLDNYLSDTASDKIVITNSFFPERETFDEHLKSSQYAGYFEQPYGRETKQLLTMVVNRESFERDHDLYCSMSRTSRSNSLVLYADNEFPATLIYTSMAAILFQGHFSDIFDEKKVIIGIVYSKPLPFFGQIKAVLNAIKTQIPNCS